jgi:hypothetical protein
MDELEMECMSSKELRKNGYGNKLIDSREGWWYSHDDIW